MSEKSPDCPDFAVLASKKQSRSKFALAYVHVDLLIEKIHDDVLLAADQGCNQN